jgi:hypothetical protein
MMSQDKQTHALIDGGREQIGAAVLACLGPDHQKEAAQIADHIASRIMLCVEAILKVGNLDPKAEDYSRRLGELVHESIRTSCEAVGETCAELLSLIARMRFESKQNAGLN